MGSDRTGTEDGRLERARELRSFLFLVIVLLPAISIAIVGALGLGIWIADMLGGPPGPPL